ncbi:MAG: site-specific integrase [Rhodospirillales bacterium]|nr:site-specific integrase [Rhodospirillales bacterium]
MKLSDACDAYLRDMEAQHLRPSTLSNYKSLFRAWQSYANDRGLTELSDFDQTAMRAWRESWVCKPGTQVRQLQQLRAFFSHSVRAGWIDGSPMTALKPPRSRSKPIMPLSRDEVASLITAAAQAGKSKERALILLMRYSGLAIRDAVTLRCDAIDNQGILTLRRAKSGELVIVPLHDLAIEALEKISQPDQLHFFWTAHSQPETVTKYWRTRLNLVARIAGVVNFTTHRLRHTFAVELLKAKVPIKQVSTLLGHNSVITTERVYAQWDMSQRDQLVEIMEEVNACDPLPELINGRMPRKTTRGPRPRPPKSAPAPFPVTRSSRKV